AISISSMPHVFVAPTAVVSASDDKPKWSGGRAAKHPDRAFPLIVSASDEKRKCSIGMFAGPAVRGAAIPAPLTATTHRTPPIRARDFMRCLLLFSARGLARGFFPLSPLRIVANAWGVRSFPVAARTEVGNESAARALAAGGGRAWYDL